MLDACVLYPAPLRDLLLSLAAAGIYRAKWSQRIHDEWTGNLLGNRPDLDPGRLKVTCTRMNIAVPDSMVTGYEDVIESLNLPDPDDRHVLAVAIRSDADTIVTFNQRVAASHSFNVVINSFSRLAEAIRVPSGLNDTPMTGVCP